MKTIIALRDERDELRIEIERLRTDLKGQRDLYRHDCAKLMDEIEWLRTRGKIGMDVVEIEIEQLRAALKRMADDYECLDAVPEILEQARRALGEKP